ncbi:flagellin hook IN motif-containing protein, partial [Pseudoalteromonas sp. bablab_jr010]|uniref:flagellin hook IN motif-containing protein n=1 Tax=Pseudoalteromonas sp. bablab_jr010 TaxID=2755063 RepID=UPI002458A5FC
NANETIGVTLKSVAASDIGSFETTLAGAAASALGLGRAAAAADNATLAANGVAGGALTVNGIDLPAAIGGGAEASEIATAINELSNSTGVTADARSQAEISLTAADSVTFELNGTQISASVADTSDLTDLASAINAETSNTGVTAESKDGKLVLTDESGKDINISDFTAATADMEVKGVAQDGTVQTTAIALDGQAAAADSVAVAGSIKLSSDNSFSVVTATDADLGADA